MGKDNYHGDETMTLSKCPVTIFADGGVNLDGEHDDNLMAFWAWGGASGSTLHRAARAIFPSRPAGYVSVTGSLRGYAANKATAMRCRATGDLAAAQVYERICETIYDELPEWARW